MSAYSINLRSENPSLLVEFYLPPGTHARIGAAQNAEVFLPLAGLEDFVCMIGRTGDGRLYLSDPDGENVRFIELPAALPLPPYQFVMFHPADLAETLQTPKTPTLAKQPAVRKILTLAGLGLAVIALAALIAVDRSRNMATVPPPASPADVPDATPDTLQAQVDKPPSEQQAPASEPQPGPPKPNASTAAEVQAPVPIIPPPVTKFDLEALAQRITPAVFRLEVKDSSGTITGTGTAFAITDDGLAVTSFHVVQGGETFTARTTQGAEFAVSGVTAADPAADLAIIALKASKLPVLELGESERLKIGAPVAVFGCPQGLSGTLSEGILSAWRTEQEIAGKTMPNGGRLLQITAPISPGSSGSPVFDQAGKVIGVVASGFVTPGTQNLNFIIPVEAVIKLRKESRSTLADLVPRIDLKKQAAQPGAKPDPNAEYYNDPETANLKRYVEAADGIESLKSARALVAKHPDSPAAHGNHSIALFMLGLSQQAETAAQRSLALDPEMPFAWELLANAQKAQGKMIDARASWMRAVALDPDSARIWHQIAVSYILESRFMDALKPMETLRKLDRGSFEKILSVLRSFRSQSPALRSVLAHFNAKAAGEIHNDNEAPDPAKLATSLVAAFLRHGNEPDAKAELADYADVVDPYFDNGRKTRAQIAKDIVDYRAKWPMRSYELIEIDSARRDDLDILEAVYRFRYSASNGKTTRRGVLNQGIQFKRINGRWLVTSVQTIK
jgi:S1-C subfamily serine protease